MASLDTRLHRLEAMVAGLLAWQNVAEKSLAELEQRLCSGQPGCDLWAGGPEPAAEYQNVPPLKGQTSAPYTSDSRPAPAQADQPAPQQPRSCATCACEPGSIECEGCTPGLPLGWQPRSGGG